MQGAAASLPFCHNTAQLRILERSSDTFFVIELSINWLNKEKVKINKNKKNIARCPQTFDFRSMRARENLDIDLKPARVSCESEKKLTSTLQLALNRDGNERCSLTRRHRPMSVAIEQCGMVGVNCTKI